MKVEAGKETQRSDCVDAAGAMAAGVGKIPQAQATLGRQRPPEVDAARQRELQVAAEAALLDQPNEEKPDSPEPGKCEQVRIRMRSCPEADPSAPIEKRDQRRKNRESGYEPAAKSREDRGAG